MTLPNGHDPANHFSIARVRRWRARFRGALLTVLLAIQVFGLFVMPC